MFPHPHPGTRGSPSQPQPPLCLLTVSLGFAAINQAIKEGNAAQTLRVLHSPDVGLCGVVAECAAAYQAQFSAILAARRPAGKREGPYCDPNPVGEPTF